MRIKELKEKGYQLRAIRDMLHSDAPGGPLNPPNPAAMEKSVQPVNYTNITNQTVKQEMSGYNPAYHDELPGHNHTYRSRTADERMDEFRELMSNIVGRAIALNNEELSQQISTEVQERILKEMNYLMREQDIAQEERYKSWMLPYAEICAERDFFKEKERGHACRYKNKRCRHQGKEGARQDAYA